MTVKTLTGHSIQDALAKAREELGEDVVLMESTPATADAPAEIAVMIDDSAPDPSASHTPKGRVPKPPSDDGPLPVPDTNSGSADSATSRSDAGGAGTTDFGYGGADANAPDSPSNDGASDGRDFGEVLASERGPGRGQIFPDADSRNDRNDEGTEATNQTSRSPLGGGEQRPGRPQTENAKRWAQHPLYEALLNKGLQPETVTRLFDELSDRGVDLANNSPDDLRWAFAQLLCRRIDVAGPDWGGDHLVLIGPSGAGKTSLILKMATHDRLLGTEKPVVLHLQPPSNQNTAYQNPTSLYQKFGVPVQNVRTEEDMARALRRADHFEHVLVDTPPLPLPLNESRAALRRIEPLLRPLQPLDVHFVLSATRALDNLDTDVLPHLPVQPSAVSMTHLDEAATWGRMVEWLITLDLPVQFVSEGPQVPDGGRAFSLEWFVEDVMDL